jgi:hypothetical protein
MDMPFMSYQVSVEQAVVNAGRLIKETGANAVKLEGGAAVEQQIRAIVDSGIPVCAHIGMTPQSANVFGGFKVQGKVEDALGLFDQLGILFGIAEAVAQVTAQSGKAQPLILHEFQQLAAVGGGKILGRMTALGAIQLQALHTDGGGGLDGLACLQLKGLYNGTDGKLIHISFSFHHSAHARGF